MNRCRAHVERYIIEFPGRAPVNIEAEVDPGLVGVVLKRLVR
jgi:hypothetical protein